MRARSNWIAGKALVLATLTILHCDPKGPPMRSDLGSVDAGSCPAPNVLRYERPGCGSNAMPRCGNPVMDLCAASTCSCTGKVITGCDYWPEPWSRHLAPGEDPNKPCDPSLPDM